MDEVELNLAGKNLKPITPTGEAMKLTELTVGTRVAISAITQADGTLKAYTLKFYSGSQLPK